MNYSNIHNMNKIFWVLWVPGVQQRSAGPKKSNRYFFPSPEPQSIFRIGLVRFSNLSKIFILKKELHKNVHKKSGINLFISYIILNKFMYSI